MKFALPLILLLATAPLLAAEPSAELDEVLTADERRWLEGHPAVRVGFDAQFPPHSFLGAGDALEGLAVELWALLAQRTGLTFQHRAAPWKEVLNLAESGELDAIATMVPRADRRERYGFTKPYVHKTLVVVSRAKDPRFRSVEDLAKKKVALVRGYQYVRRVLRRYPGVEPVYVDSILDALNAVSTQKADCTIAFQGAVHHLTTQYLITNLQFAAVYDRSSSAESIGVRKDWPTLVSILDKALATIPTAERLKLAKRWLPEPPEHQGFEHLELSAAQEAWLDAHPVVRLGVDPEFHPFEFFDGEGRYRGITADYLDTLGRKLGVRFQVTRGLTWKEAVAKVRARELDLLPAIGKTQEREGSLAYSQPYLEFHRVIVTRVDTPFMRGVEDLSDLRVAVQADSSHAGFLADRTEIEPLAYPTLQETLTAVSDGKADAMVGNLASATYWIRRLNLTNLKVAAAASKEVYTLHFGVRQDWPELTGILDRGIRAMSERERSEIAHKWVKLRFDPRVDHGPLWRAAGAGLAVLLLLLLWNSVIRRHRDRENAARVEAERANAELQGLRAELEDRVRTRTEELRSTRRRYHRAQKLEAVGTFVSGIVHDLNNLLAGVQGALTLVRAQVEAGEDVRAELALAEDACAHGSEVIDQLMAYVRKESARAERIELASLAEKTRDLARARSGAFEVELDVPAGLELRGTPPLLQQALLNLLLNAQDALEGASAPRLGLRAALAETPAEHAGQLQSERCVRIEVWDNGPGIPPETRERLFEPFFTTKPPGRGTGLGLAMASSAVESHQGVIEVESSPEGTTFRIWLPAPASAGDDAAT